MKQISVIGYPRIGSGRELKRWTESYFRKELPKEQLLENAKELRRAQWQTQREMGVDYIPSNDFSFYDTFLDTSYLLNVIPARFRSLGLDGVDTYFAMAKGYQGAKGDVHALPMKKWFTTNYHYMVPEIDEKTEIRLNGAKPFEEYAEALQAGIRTKPVLLGPFTFLRLAEIQGGRKTKEDIAPSIARAYSEIIARFDAMHAELVQMDEPALVMDLTPEEISLFRKIYTQILPGRGRVKILMQTYFGDVRDIYEELVRMDFDAVGLDFVEGPENAKLIEQYGFPQGKRLFAGVVNGRNIWVNHYGQTLGAIRRLEKSVLPENIVLSTSCSLLHVPYTVRNETQLEGKYRIHFAFAQEKLEELAELARLSEKAAFEQDKGFIRNEEILHSKTDEKFRDEAVRRKVAGLREADFIRRPSFEQRRKRQKEKWKLPVLPTTTIGSFPQTPEVRQLRRRYKSGEISRSEYTGAIRRKIAEVIRLQESIGLDVLVHGEYERNDMVEYFGEKLAGFLFMRNAWVQSYGTRCVKPPVIFGDVRRISPMTVELIRYAQSLTEKPVKGMLTGPVTILNWSFPREDLPRREIAFQIALAIREEVEDLEAAGIRIIQIDEAALREKLPLRRRDWHSRYLDWAIPAFRLVHSGVKPETQIHTHMCYSEFGDILEEIDTMDADVITFEAAKSDLSIIGQLSDRKFKTEVGSGVYDIHSPRIPDTEEMEAMIQKMVEKLDAQKLWVNPDCGLKTRGMKETAASLKNMVEAARRVRSRLKAR